MIVRIENIGGIWYINQKRLFHDQLTEVEIMAINDFFKQWKIASKE